MSMNKSSVIVEIEKIKYVLKIFNSTCDSDTIVYTLIILICRKYTMDIIL